VDIYKTPLVVPSSLTPLDVVGIVDNDADMTALEEELAALLLQEEGKLIP